MLSTVFAGTVRQMDGFGPSLGCSSQVRPVGPIVLIGTWVFGALGDVAAFRNWVRFFVHKIVVHRLHEGIKADSL